MSSRAATIALAAALGSAMTLAGASGAPTATDPADALPTVLLSRQLMRATQLSVGDVVALSAEPSGGNARSFRIAGEYEPVPDPMRLGATRHEARLHLPDLLRLSTGAPQEEVVDAINVAVEPGRAAAVARDIANRMPGVYVQSTTGDDRRAAPFVVLERFHLAIAVVTVVASSIFLLALMLMLVDERRSTVGILRLIGFRRRRILVYVFTEGLVIAAAGAVFGVAIAAAFQGVVNEFFQWKYDTALVFVRITPRIVLRSTAMAVPLGVLAAVASSWTLLRRDVFSLARR